MLHFGKAGRKSNCRQTCCWTTNSTQSKYGHIDRKLIYSKLLISKSNKVLQVWHRLQPPCLSIPLRGKFIWKPRKSVQWHGCICFIGKKKRDSLYFPSRSMSSLSPLQVNVPFGFPPQHLSKPCRIQCHSTSYKVFPTNWTARSSCPVFTDKFNSGNKLDMTSHEHSPLQEFCQMHMNICLPRKTVTCNRRWES